MKSKWAVYKELELISEEEANPRALWPMVKAWMHHVWTAVLENITNRSTIRIWKKTDGIGHTWWYAYDSNTHTTHCFASEGEVRVWLESRYYNAGPKPFFYNGERLWH